MATHPLALVAAERQGGGIRRRAHGSGWIQLFNVLNYKYFFIIFRSPGKDPEAGEQRILAASEKVIHKGDDNKFLDLPGQTRCNRAFFRRRSKS
jgi:hypothetical protein